MSAPGAGKTTLLERVLADGSTACASACSRATSQGSLDADRLAALHVPVVQLNTDPGFGGECHLDANMVRSALPSLPLRRHRPAGRSRTSATSSARPSSGSARTRGSMVSLGHRGRGQAAEVPADVPRLRARRGQQDRPARAPRLRPRPVPATTSTPCTRASSGCCVSARTGRGRGRSSRDWLAAGWRRARAGARACDASLRGGSERAVDALLAERAAGRTSAFFAAEAERIARLCHAWPSASRAAGG